MKYLKEIETWDKFSKFHIYNSASLVISEFKNQKELVIVDVGANSGTYFDELNKHLDVKKAILFEVQPNLYQYLVEKYKNNPNVIVENIALSDRVENFELNDVSFRYEIENNVGSSSYNLGLSKIQYDKNGSLQTNYFDNIKSKYNLEKIDILKIDTETEDLLVLKGFTQTIKNLKIKPIIELENNWWEKYSYEESQSILDNFCKECGYINNVNLNKRGDFFIYPKKKQNTTIVTGLWDLNRGSLGGWAKRDFQHYKDRFFEMLKTDIPMCVWIPKDLKEEVEEIRKDKPTKIFIKNIKDFETWNPFFNKIQEIRKSKNWLSQADWLKDSPQGALEYYNAMMFTKMFMLNDSALINPFESKYFFWIDGGLTNTVSPGYFHNELVLNNLENYMNYHNAEFIQIVYPYTANNEIHGFERKAMAKYCNVDFVREVSRGGFFGGEKQTIHKLNNEYYSIMESSLKENLMGADESLFTILRYKNPTIINKFNIDYNGLVWPFFEELLKYKEPIKTTNKIGLYVITFNSPKQFETLINSILHYDENFIKKTKKFLLDNSTDISTTPKYKELCEKYGFEHIKKENIGITGGRQWIAEHFHKQENLEYYFFFEDDMFFVNKNEQKVCKAGFNRIVEDLFYKSLEILKKENFDFLKLNFSEFYGTNEKQWAWYNVPQEFRKEKWPNYCNLPKQGLDPNSPSLEYKYIKTHKDVPYASGEIYICNWPILLSKKGNYKCYIETKFSNPFEQTIMSHCYQETTKGKIRPGLLLITPTEHNRFDHYDGKLRKEC